MPARQAKTGGVIAKAGVAKPVRKKKAPPRRTVTVTSTTTYKLTQAEYDWVISQALENAVEGDWRYRGAPKTTRVTVEGAK